MDEDIYSFVRAADGFEGFLVAMNFGKEQTVVNFRKDHSDIIPATGSVVEHTANFNPIAAEDFQIGREMELDRILLQPGEGVVFKWPADAFEN